MSKSGTETTIYGPALPNCDICYYTENHTLTEAAYDGKTDGGPWAYMCERHFQTHGTGLGIGRGQRLKLAGKEKE